ncbi:MAG: hypothetical protein AB7G28_19330 [Pirellulales bacterium]
MVPYSIQERPDSLVIVRPRGNGCAVVFLFVWLTGWTFGLVNIATHDWSAASWNALVLMGLTELLVLGFFVYSLTGRERLTIRPRDVTYEHSAIVNFDRCVIRTENILSLDLVPLDPTKRKDHAVGVIVVDGGDAEIRFGEGLSGLELHELLVRIRQKLAALQTELPPTISAGQVPPISDSQRKAQDTKSEALPTRILQWLTVPFFIVAGCAFLFGGVSFIRTGRPLFIFFGIFFTCIGLILSVGLAWASVAVFLDWLRPKRSKAAIVDLAEAGPLGPQTLPLETLSLSSPPAHPRTQKRTRSWTVPLEAILLAPVIVAALIIRFRSIPWDEGGSFFQVWLSIVGLGVLAALPQFRPLPRIVAALVLLPILLFLLWAAPRFAPQAMLPFGLFAGVAVGACYLWSQAKQRLAVALALALIPIAGDAYFYGAPHMRTVERLRHLLPEEIKEVHIERSSDGTSVVIRDPEPLAAFAKALSDTSPYSPNHEGISRPRQIQVRLVDGSAIDFHIGTGNRAQPKTIWIEFGVEVYQNPSLYPVLQSSAFALTPQPAER